MALYKVQVKYTVFGKQRSVVWYIDAASLADAALLGSPFAQLVRRFLLDSFSVDEVVVSSKVKDGRTFEHINIGQPGMRDSEAGSPLKAFNVVKLEHTTVQSDSGFHLFRGCLVSTDIEADSTLKGTVLTELQTGFNTWATSFPSSVSAIRVGDDAKAVYATQVDDNVFMRQERRRRRKKVDVQVLNGGYIVFNNTLYAPGSLEV